MSSDIPANMVVVTTTITIADSVSERTYATTLTVQSHKLEEIGEIAHLAWNQTHAQTIIAKDFKPDEETP